MTWVAEVEFRKSSVHGMGAFALEPIRKGTKVWTVDPAMQFAGPADLRKLPLGEIRFALHGGYLHQPSQTFVYYADGMEYVNHAPGRAANIGIREWTPLMKDNCTALRDIEAGEELMEDYSFWSIMQVRKRHWLIELYREFCPEHYSFLLSIEEERLKKVA